MKKIICFLVASGLFLSAFSQKNYFIYLQTESALPFYVKLANRTYSSSSVGYIILSNLHDTVCNFSVGFPKDKWPEQKFSVHIHSKDHGFLLKNFEDGSWGLFDLQTMAIQIAPVDARKSNIQNRREDVSQFTYVLSRAANDPSLMDKPMAAVRFEEKPVAEKPVIAAESALRTGNAPTVNQEIIEKKENTNPAPLPEYKRSVVTRGSESSTTEGFGLTFFDADASGNVDTVKIVIPEPANNVAKEKSKQDNVKFLDFESNAGTKQSISSQLGNNECLSVASEKDFFELRRMMAGETSSDAMISQAKKYFDSKCFTVLQVKNIGTLFLNDEEKYKFFYTAHSHVSDVENFQSLQSELKDEYYVNRFKAILK